jgi:pyruvate formate lyase activating enzyme
MSIEAPHDGVIGTRYWHELADGKLQCDVCPRRCQLADGQRGLCFVRARRGDEVVLTTFGRSSGYCVDPIEKKPLNHFLPGTPVLSFGTAGCNLTCRFCQNWDISKSREIDTLADQAPPEVIARAAQKLGCRSVAFTYNDPVIFMEYAIETARACHAIGVRTVAVTAGYICDEPRREFFAHVDAANVDLKAFSDTFYRSLCGASLDAVLETLVYLRRETDVWLEITRSWRKRAGGWSRTSGPTCRGTSAPSTPTTACGRRRPRQPQRSPERARSPGATARATSTLGTFTTRPDRARTATAAAASSSVATDTS